MLHSRPTDRSALGPFARLLPGLALLACAAAPVAVEAQDAAQFMEEARKAYEARMEGIQSYTVTSVVAGMETTTRHVRQEVDGVVLFLPESMDEQAAEGQPRMNAAAFYRPDIAERMRLEATDEVEGTACRWIVLDDFEGLDFGQAMGATETSGFQPSSMRMCVDPEQYVLRKMELEGTLDAAGTTSEFATSMLFTDYRDIDGVLHPFRIEMDMGGVGQALFGGDGAGGEQSAMMEQLQQQLESLPEGQRKMMEEMMEEQMAAMGELAGGAMVVETRSIEVEQGG